jgi:hypothetical protein
MTLEGLNTIGLTIVTVLAGWAIWKLDHIVTTVVKIETVLIGMDGQRGLLLEHDIVKEKLVDQEGRVRNLEQHDPTRYMPKP